MKDILLTSTRPPPPRPSEGANLLGHARREHARRRRQAPHGRPVWRARRLELPARGRQEAPPAGAEGQETFAAASNQGVRRDLDI